MIKSKFSEKLIELRKLHKYKQKYVAKALGVTTRVYAYWEQGHFPENETYIAQLCEFYQVSANELLGVCIEYKYKGEVRDE